MISREMIETHLAELRARCEQAKADANALLGAIQADEHWLRVLDKPEGITLDQLKQSLGADSVEIVKNGAVA